MNTIEFIQKNINFLNDIQAYHWQTRSYSEHNALSEYYKEYNSLLDKYVETYQGKIGKRITFSAELRPGILNYADVNIVKLEVKKIVDHITNFSKNKEVIGQIDLESIIEDMLLVTNQLLYHLSLK